MKKLQHLISGQAFIGDDLEFTPVDIVIEDGIITAIEDNPGAPGIWICPAFFNAHTHLGDTIAMDCGAAGDLASMVAPPYGLKHRLLAQASPGDLTRGIRASIEGMMAGGVAGCADFREGGPEGVARFSEAAAGLPFRSLVFGRDGGEMVADGLGVSSVRDVPGAEAIVREARRAGKKIAFHAGERDAADIDAAISFDPDLIIHATHASKKQIRACAEKGIPLAVCPRSNWTLGVATSARLPPLRQMLDAGCTLYLGTDNVMFVSPDIRSEMAFCSTVYRIDPKTLLHAAIRGSELAGSSFFIRRGTRANLFTLDPAQSALCFSRNPVLSLITRTSGYQPGDNVFNL